MAGIENFRAETAEACEEIARFDFVRSYDFEHDDGSYVVGRVQHTDRWIEGCPRYEIAVLKHVVCGEAIDRASSAGRYVYPPRNGVPHSFGGFCNAVRKLEGEELEYWRERWDDWASDVDVT